MKKIDYYYPVTDYEAYNFIDCYSSLYMFLEKMSYEPTDYPCAKQETGGCNWCGMCYKSEIIPPAKMKEDLLYTFETLSGFNTGLVPWEGKNTVHEEIVANTPDFLLKYTGYEYELLDNNIEEQIKKSINSQIPVIANLKNKNCTIIIGFDDNQFITLQKNSENIISADEIKSIYIITQKTKPKYNLYDALMRIKYVMDNDNKEQIWNTYINNFNNHCNLEELKEKMTQVDIATNWNIHSFGRGFYLRRLKELQDERISEHIENIGVACDESHTARWQAKAMFCCRNWSKSEDWSIENGYRTLIQEILKRIKNDDDLNYNSICEMIKILEK